MDSGFPVGKVTRRRVLRSAGQVAAGLWLGIELPGDVLAQSTAAAGPAPRTTFNEPQLAAYLEITADNVVRVALPDAEMGQGVYSALPLILADELGADWARVEVRQTGADDRLANPMKGFQATGRSLSVRGYYALLRRLGATARQLLCTAAAARWSVPAAECRTEQGSVRHARSGRQATFAELLEAAAALPLPLEIHLRTPDELQLIGRDVPRKDIPAKVAGTAEFSSDVRLPGMLVAAIAHSPVFGSALESLDEAAALAGPGVRAVVRLPSAVAVVAGDFWQASRALGRLRPTFAPGPNDTVDSATLGAARAAGLREPGVPVQSVGDAEARIAAADRQLEFVYEVPYLAHATMEPMCCVAWVRAGDCDLWAPTQGPGRLRNEVARELNIEPGRVRITRSFIGGGFGRRWQPDFGIEAALISKAVNAPVKLLWSREEDMQHDFYRPAMHMRVRAGLASGRRGAAGIAGVDITLSGALLSSWGKPPVSNPKPDPQLTGGLTAMPYALPDYRIRWVPQTTHVPIGVWRSVAHSHNVFAIESALDELAVASGEDPLRLRLDLLKASPRHQRVLAALAKQAKWRRRDTRGQASGQASKEGRGLAIAEYASSIIALVADVQVLPEGRVRVLRLTAAVDCGAAIQPDNVRAQVEGGLLYGLTAALYGEIRIEQGRAVQSNFFDYRMMTLADCPEIDVLVLPGGDEPGGVGELATPPVAPALANAVFAATGKRVRELPLARHGLA
ncbi:MAG: molybdopterin cofactor-binding domain-containing protein [Gammaproteobacteria bacterium]